MAFGRKKAKQDQEDATARALLASELATLRTIMERYPAGSMLSFGSPSRCPECGDYGIVRGVNHAKGACDNHCRVCRRDWVITARALQAYYLASTGPASAVALSMTVHDEPLSLDDDPLSIEPVEADEAVPARAPVMADYNAAVLANDPEPVSEPVPEPVQATEPTPVAAPVMADYRTPAAAPVPAPEPIEATAPTPEPAPAPEPVLADYPAPVTAPVPMPEPIESAEPVTAPLPAPEPTPVTEPTALPQPVAAVAPLPPPPPVPVVAQTLPPHPTPAPAADAPAAPAEIAVDLTEPLPLLRVLVVDDNLFDFAMIEELLEPFVSSGEIELEHRATRRQGEEAVRSFPFDLVLLDLDLHDTSGLTTVLEWNHRAGEPLPLIALIDEADADLTQQTSTAGIHGVIQKAHLEKLTTQGEAGQKRLHKLLRTTAAKAVEPEPDPRWRRKRTKPPVHDSTRVGQILP